MMKIEELRIGLWVYLFGDAVQLTADHLVYILARNSTPEPITLIEDWLIKFGFEKYYGYGFGASLEKVPYFVFHDVTIIFSDEFWYSVKEYDGGTSENYEPKVEIKSVHQIQDLVRILTGIFI